MKVLLVSTYELGHQPVHLAQPAGALRARGHEVRALDVSVEPWDDTVAAQADVVAFSVPMHTAARLALPLLDRVDAPVAAYGLYAAVLPASVERIAGEYLAPLVAWVDGGGRAAPPGLRVDLGSHAAPALPLPVPARDLLPPLDRYARLRLDGEERLVGAVEATRGCAHRCRHCPVPVVYDGRTRSVAEEAVLADVDQLVALGARHVTFADPDFLNRPHHARRIVAALHAAHPDLTWDCTVKVEHIVRHADLWAPFAAAGCLFVVSAFESVDDAELARLAKGHTAADAARAVRLLREQRIEVRPSWMPFTPWATLTTLHGLVDFVADHDLVPNVDPIQYTIRLLLPTGSLLLALPELAPHLDGVDPDGLSHRWRHPDPDIDALQRELAELVERAVAHDEPVGETYARVRAALGAPARPVPAWGSDRPRLTESWFCCAEPSRPMFDLQASAETRSAS